MKSHFSFGKFKCLRKMRKKKTLILLIIFKYGYHNMGAKYIIARRQKQQDLGSDSIKKINTITRKYCTYI